MKGEIMSRISRDEMFMKIAEVVATRGTCDRAQVGAVLVSHNRVISIGYNGSPPGEPHCDDVGHLMVDGHCVRAIHAEVNCVNFAVMFHTDTAICDLYVTHLPCINCCRFIRDNNKHYFSHVHIAKVIYDIKYGDSDIEERINTLKEGGVTLEQFNL